MNKKVFLMALSILTMSTFIRSDISESSDQMETKRRRQKPKEANPPILNYEEEKQKDHEKVCNILGFASNIFGNFVQIVKEPNNQDNIGEQVGNMAENMFHIVAEATKAKIVEQSDQETENLLQYLESDGFKEDLQKIVDEILKEEKQ